MPADDAVRALANEDWFKAPSGRETGRVAQWVTTSLADAERTPVRVRDDLVRLSREAEPELGDCCLFAANPTGHCPHVVGAVADRLLREFYEWAQAQLPNSPRREPGVLFGSPSGDPNGEGTASDWVAATALPFNLLVRAERTFFTTAGRVLRESQHNVSGWDVDDRVGSARFESHLVDTMLAAEVGTVLTEANAAFARARDDNFDGIAFRAVSFGPVAEGFDLPDTVSNRSFCDLWLVLEATFPNHGHVERFPIAVNVKAVKDDGDGRTAQCNTGGMAMMAWAQLGSARKRTRVSETVAEINEALRSPALPMTDYVFWVFAKQSDDSAVIGRRHYVVSLLSLDPTHESKPLRYNPAQSFPSMQLQLPVPAGAARPPHSVGEARTRLWAYWERCKAAEVTEVLSVVSDGTRTDVIGQLLAGLTPAERRRLLTETKTSK